ncbi:MAG: heavy metal translocating P-type ATPase metal-binding domain-containing protein [Ignavibacteriales bacterium]|nr:heavy metal translocating P-type ATPase metal-binding domain-containing protein [Ignavibacteriales bacterium]
MNNVSKENKALCFHCGAPAGEVPISYDEKLFCCNGCKSVYEILDGKQLYRYYNFSEHPGITPNLQPNSKYAFLDDPKVSNKFISFSDDKIAVVNLHIPQMHCSSCIWLLENLHNLHPGILISRVDFLKKSLLIRYKKDRTTFRQIIEMLVSIGYEPELSPNSTDTNQRTKSERSFYLKIGVAAFCFGNIMLFSLPEYLSSSAIDLSSRTLFGYLNLILSLPVIFFSSMVYFSSAINSLRTKAINIDVPIALGIAIVFLRSAVEVLFQIGPGYFDSLTGLVFFLLIGRLFQNKTYDALNFERKYQSYFSLAVTVRRAGQETTVPITIIRPGERMLIRNNEIVPADSIIMSGIAYIDYSFVTGESQMVMKNVGDLIYAGGKHHGSVIELEAIKEVSESEFIQLWNEFDASDRIKSQLLTLSNTIGKYFTLGILFTTLTTAFWWWYVNPSIILDAVTAILIVACPCAIALAAPFVFGTTLRLFGKKGFYLKHSSIVEALSKTDTIAFDKTGTITQTKLTSIRFEGSPLTDEQRKQLASLVRSSTHPLSRSIYDFLHVKEIVNADELEEVEGAGIAGKVGSVPVRLGSAEFLNIDVREKYSDEKRTVVYAAIDEKIIGRFEFDNIYRSGLQDVLKNLENNQTIYLLSGDSDGERSRLKEIYPNFADMIFNQKPADKLSFIKLLQDKNRNVIMVGDGLNDAGALWQSNVAISVTEDVSSFSPSCDAILNSSSFNILDRFIRFATTAKHIVYWSFVISIIYNIVGLYFAVRGELSPILAAILMPLSSITVVTFSTFITQLMAKRRGLI